jgi:hypothetical protein
MNPAGLYTSQEPYEIDAIADTTKTSSQFSELTIALMTFFVPAMSIAITGRRAARAAGSRFRPNEKSCLLMPSMNI